MTTEVLSAATFPVAQLRWRVAGSPVSGGGAVSGPGFYADLAGAGWLVAELTGMDLADADDIHTWRGLLLDPLDGVEQVIVEMHDWPLAAGTITATISSAATLDAPQVAITINPAAGYEPARGHPFTIVYPTLGPHIHFVKKVVSHVGNVWTCEIKPNVHEALVGTETADFNDRRCVMRAVDNGEAWPVVGEGWTSTVSIRFEESFDPATEA